MTNTDEILCEGKHLRFKKRNGWEFVERRDEAAGVMIVAVTADERLLLVEEFRPPLAAHVVSLPAGLVGDEGHAEDPEQAARRELVEETGYECSRLERLGGGPTSPGLSSETMSFFRATGLSRVGDPSEEGIRVHAIALGDLLRWTDERTRQGVLIHPMLWAGLHLSELRRD
jgi:ADP-ribose pyrophosphatase